MVKDIHYSFEIKEGPRKNLMEDPMVVSNRFLPGLPLQGCKAEPTIK